MNQTLTPQTKMLLTINRYPGLPTVSILKAYQSEWVAPKYSGEGCNALEALIVANLVRADWNRTNDDIVGWRLTVKGIDATDRYRENGEVLS